MNMKFVGIVAGSVLLLVILYYVFIGSSDNKAKGEGTSCKTDDGKDGIITGGTCVPPRVIPDNSNPNFNPNPTPVPLPLGTGSTSVNIADTAQAVINYTGMTEDNISSYNVLTSAGSNPNRIHYVTGFSSQCPQYVWYKNWLYSYRGTESDQNGNKTCYYGIDKSVLPASLEIQILTSNTCTNFKVYVSGIEYKYDKTIQKPATLSSGMKSYCVYVKQ